jgi:hypothetical protein
MTIIPGVHRYQLWGSLVSCGRLPIGLVRFMGKTAAVANRRAGCHPAPHDLDNQQYFGSTTLLAKDRRRMESEALVKQNSFHAT